MYVGHINLEPTMNGLGEHFVGLVEALNRQGIRQHVLVSNAALAKRVAIYEQVQAGPIVRSGIVACCLMPDVDVVHVHEPRGRRAGLLLRLTRSMPYVMTWREKHAIGDNPISRSIVQRSAGLICPTTPAPDATRSVSVPVDVVLDLRYQKEDELSENRVAAEHFRIYSRAADTRRIPTMLL